MFEVVLQMAGLILCGVGWRIIKPGGLDPTIVRKALTDFVYYLLLPALVLSALWLADLGMNSLVVAALAAIGILVSLGFSILSCRWCNLPRASTGAAILAATFPNATYMGLPVLETTMGPWARGIAIQYDLFACTPLLFTLGILIAKRYGDYQSDENGLLTLGKIPAIWAAIAGVVLNLTGVPMPQLIDGFLNILDKGVVPLMLFSLGLSLQWSRSNWPSIPSVLPIALIQLFLTPLVIYVLVMTTSTPAEIQKAIVLEAAMPSMVLAMVICSRFGLDTNLYATAVTFTTAASIISLPMWFAILG